MKRGPFCLVRYGHGQFCSRTSNKLYRKSYVVIRSTRPNILIIICTCVVCIHTIAEKTNRRTGVKIVVTGTTSFGVVVGRRCACSVLDFGTA